MENIRPLGKTCLRLFRDRFRGIACGYILRGFHSLRVRRLHENFFVKLF